MGTILGCSKEALDVRLFSLSGFLSSWLHLRSRLAKTTYDFVEARNKYCSA